MIDIIKPFYQYFKQTYKNKLLLLICSVFPPVFPNPRSSIFNRHHHARLIDQIWQWLPEGSVSR